MNQIRLKIPAHADYVDLVRFSLFGIASNMGFSYEDIDDMKVAATEACNNAVQHADPQGALNMIIITFEIEERSLSIRVKDNGLSLNYKEEMANAKPLDTKKEVSQLRSGDLGLFLMQALMDEVTIDTEDGTEIMMTKYIPKQSPLDGD
jgi:serine/threonine-protein kinase RsbW